MNISDEHLQLIDEYANIATEIEISIFTKKYHLSHKHLGILSVQSISMLYSLWEGYIQKTFQMYLAYINNQKISFDCLSDKMKIYYMNNAFKQFKDYPRDEKKQIEFFKKLRIHFANDEHKFPTCVDTKSNINFDVMNQLLSNFSLSPFPEYWGNYTYPNLSLKFMINTFLRYRNGVAHGGDISSEEKVTKEVYSKYRLLIVDLMYEIHLKILDGIENKQYLK